jgi:phage FluMu gp28-like protein
MSFQLLGYQKKWLSDESRFKIGMFARQTGKTFTNTLELVQDGIREKKRWVILSRGERQAKEAMDAGVKVHLEVYKQAFEYLEYEFDAKNKALECVLPNGSRITALPANPDTARGFSANVLLDEFAFHADSHKIWRALFPVISAGHKLRIVSTPNGKSGKFYELMTGNDPVWSRHVIDIYQAVEQGLDRNIEELRNAMNDPDAWATEYELQWLDSASAWLDYDLINCAETPNCLGNSLNPDNPHYLGWDVARRRDLSVLWVSELVGDVLWTRDISAMRRASFASQIEQFEYLMRNRNIKRACIDQTGMGEVLVEQMIKKYGSRVEGVLFTAGVKQDLSVSIKQRFEDGRYRIPIDRDIRDSLHSIKRLQTSAGNFRFDAERSESTGHADYYWAMCLANHASDRKSCEVDSHGVVLNNWSRGFHDDRGLLGF